MTLKWRVRLSPVPRKRKTEPDHRPNLPLFAPRIFVKCPSIRRMDGRGGGDRKHYRLEFQGLRRNAGERGDIEKQRGTRRLIIVIRLQLNLKKLPAAKPPACPTVLPERSSEQLLRVSKGKPQACRMQGDHLALSIRESEQVTIARLPWVFAGILDRLRVSVSNECQSRVQVGFCGSASSPAGAERFG